MTTENVKAEEKSSVFVKFTGFIKSVKGSCSNIFSKVGEVIKQFCNEIKEVVKELAQNNPFLFGFLGLLIVGSFFSQIFAEILVIIIFYSVIMTISFMMMDLITRQSSFKVTKATEEVVLGSKE